MEKKILITIILTLVVGLVLGAVGGYYYGSSAGTKNLRDVVGLVFPEPPQEIFAVSGLVKEAAGARLVIETADFNDYLPHTDGTPAKKIDREVFLSGATKMTLLYPASIDEKGNMKQETISENDIKVGMMVTVKSATNLRDAKTIEATELEAIQY
ncbi:hypothetical protein C4565_01040 [Candidatus Parcubacteria bacterium]|jgi:hypothetical protein|nr:MAG: hypothetical protein C4565_01040 [Candidatus Parcubacteria bacterium]